MPQAVVTNPYFACVATGVPTRSTGLWRLLQKKEMNLSCDYVKISESQLQLSNGNESIMRLCYDWSVKGCDCAVAHTARYGRIEIVIQCHSFDIEWTTTCTAEGITKKSCNCVTSEPPSIQIKETHPHHHHQS